jgi:DNA polymerase-3 subunit epsilon
MTGYAVVDVETTGFSPAGHDRIVEVAVVQVSPWGEVESRWTTLVNPQRDLGPQHVHGIAAADVLAAPTFDRIAGTLATLLAGRAFVAHNASFDTRFVQSEFGALGYDVPVVPQTSVCTMRWASQFMPHAPRTLAGCCQCAGIHLDDAHAALADATATAALLAHYLRLMGIPGRPPVACAPAWSDVLELAATARWPSIPVHDVAPAHRGNATRQSAGFLERVVEHLPRSAAPCDHQEYLALLDRALLDRLLSVREKHALVETAHSLGIDRATAAGLHRDYLRALARTALAAGVVTPEEQRDLELVAGLLSLTPGDVAAALCEEAVPVQSSAEAKATPCGSFSLRPGDRVVFTGDMALSRDEWIARAVAAGLSAHPNVTKDVSLVVAADPDSLSGKARKAAAYGIPIVTENAFAEMLRELSTSTPR